MYVLYVCMVCMHVMCVWHLRMYVSVCCVMYVRTHGYVLYLCNVLCARMYVISGVLCMFVMYDLYDMYLCSV